MEEEYRYWELRYVSCEGNNRISHYKTPGLWEACDVRDHLILGGCGDDIAEVVSIEETGFDEDYLYDELT